MSNIQLKYYFSLFDDVTIVRCSAFSWQILPKLRSNLSPHFLANCRHSGQTDWTSNMVFQASIMTLLSDYSKFSRLNIVICFYIYFIVQ